MKKATKVIIFLIVTVLFSISVYNLINVKKEKQVQFSWLIDAFSGKGLNKWQADSINSMFGPEDKVEQVIAEVNKSIQTHSRKAQSNGTWYFWVTVITTMLTAGATLISSIQAFKRETPNPGNAQMFTVIIAVVTFCSTVTNCFSTHFNAQKAEHIKKTSDLVANETAFITNYANAETPEKKQAEIDRLRTFLVATD